MSFTPFRLMPSLPGMKLPAWLRARVSSRVLYTGGLILDALTTLDLAAVKARFPSTAQPDAIPYLARDRDLDRGPNESDAAIVGRISTSFDKAATTGHPRELLGAVLAYFSPSTPQVRTVTDLSVWDTISAGVWSRVFGTAGGNGGWNWDGNTRWFRAWIIIYSPSFTAPSTFAPGGRKFGDGLTFGSSAKSGEAQALRNIAKKGKPANESLVNILVPFASTWFDPTQPAGGGINPDGSWGRPYKSVAGNAVPSRPSGIAFFGGVT
jgi:hypothetical protein